jgi:hypothetical protein
MILGSLKQRFVELALRRALPRTPWIPYARLGLLGLTAAIAGGMLFTLACLALLGGLFFYLQEQGIRPSYALLIIAGVSLAASGWIFFATQRYFFSKAATSETMLPPQQPEDALFEIPGAIVSSFLQGVLNGENRPRPRH